MKKKVSFFLIFVLIGLFAYLMFMLVSWFLMTLKHVNPSLGSAIIAGAATVISSVFIASYNSRKAKERVAFEANKEKKAALYNEFMDIVVQLMRNTKAGKKGDEVLPDNVEEFFYDFTSKITVYGGPGVVKAYSQWRSASENGKNEINNLFMIDNLFREMRKDLGESNKGILKNELLGLFIIGGRSQLAKEASKLMQENN